MLPKLRAALVIAAVAAVILAGVIVLRQDHWTEPAANEIPAQPAASQQGAEDTSEPGAPQHVQEPGLAHADAAAVSGRLVDRETGEGIENAGVALRRDRQGSTADHETVTTADGRYTFNPVSPGRWHVRVEPGPRHFVRTFEAETQLTLEPGETTEGVDFDFEPGTVIRGRVEDEAGEPVPGAEIFVRGYAAARDREWRSDHEGRFVAGPVESYAQVRIDARAGRLVAVEPVNLDISGRRTVDDVTIPLQRGAMLSGVVLDEKRNPIKDMSIVMRHESDRPDPQTLTTDDRGRFVADGLLPGATLLDLAGNRRSFHLAAGEAKENVEIVLPAGARHVRRVDMDDEEEHDGPVLRGVVFREEDSPAPDTKLVAFQEGRLLPGPVTADENGAFRIPVRDSVSHEIWAYHPDYGVGKHAYTQPNGEPAEILLEPSAVLRGAVVDVRTGEPVPAFAITLAFAHEQNPFAPPGAQGQTFHNADGSFELVSPAPVSKPHRLVVSADGYQMIRHDLGPVGPGAVKDDIQILADPGCVLVVRVTDTNRRPVPGARVTWRASPEHHGAPGLMIASHDHSKHTGGDGAVELAGLPDDQVNIRVNHDDYTEVHRTVVPSPHHRKTVDIELYRGGSVEGAVYLGQEPYTGAHVRIHRRGRRTEAHSDGDGRYRLEGIPAGEAVIELTIRDDDAARGDQRYQKRAFISEGETVRVDFLLPSGLGGLEGYVMQDGVPLPNMTVAAMADTDAGESVRVGRSNEDGWYEIEGVPPGPVRVGTMSSHSGASQWSVLEDTFVRADYIRRHDIDLRVDGAYTGRVMNIPPDSQEVFVLILTGHVQGSPLELGDQVILQRARYMTSVDESGGFTAPSLDAGAYTLVAISEAGRLGLQAGAEPSVDYTYRHIDIRDSEEADLDISF